jgi:hypothetical protein
MNRPYLATAPEHGQGWLAGPHYNLIMMLLALAGVVVAVVVPMYLARQARLGRSPRISLPVDNAQAGETVVFAAGGFKRFEVVELFFTSHAVFVKVPKMQRLGAVSLQADSKGRISELVTVPDNLPVGENLIVAERHGRDTDPTEVATNFYVLARPLNPA